MTKREQLEKLAQDIAVICPDMVENGCEQQCYTCLASMLVMRGYGNIIEFETQIHNMLVEMEELDFNTREKICNKIEQLVEGFCKEKANDLT